MDYSESRKAESKTITWLLPVICSFSFVLQFFLSTTLSAQTSTLGMSGQRTLVSTYSVPAQIADAPSVLVIGSLSGDAASTNNTLSGYEAYANEVENFLDVTFIPAANPDSELLSFPPVAPAYESNWTAWSLWRWIGTHPPDAVIIMGEDRFGLGTALKAGIMGLGSIESFTLDYENELIAALKGRKIIAASEARQNFLKRQERSAEQLALTLATRYGQSADRLTYIPAVALISRLRLGQAQAVEQLVAPLLDAESPQEITSSLQIGGYLLFAELAELTGDPRYLAQAVHAANTGFNSDGTLKQVMPFSGNYSDAIFMATPLLAKVGKLTGDQRYFDLALSHVEYLHELLLRPDGLYNHWPRTDAAWGRGNAFVALGLALALSDIPEPHRAHARLLQIFQQLMNTLLNYTDVDGMWHNVINMPGTWAEFSASAMIATAIDRGVREGWLEGFYQSASNKTWEGVLARTDAAFGFVNVCASTPGQESLEAYINRAALDGPDDRAGGMLLLFATERMQTR